MLQDYLQTGTAPAEFADACYDAAGMPIASGNGVWDGVIDNNPPGSCTDAYPIYSSSRMVAGDGFGGDMFKCQLKPVNTALNDGTYGNVSFDAAQTAQLHAIFPSGVCDYSQPDLGKPEGF